MPRHSPRRASCANQPPCRHSKLPRFPRRGGPSFAASRWRISARIPCWTSPSAATRSCSPARMARARPTCWKPCPSCRRDEGCGGRNSRNARACRATGDSHCRFISTPAMARRRLVPGSSSTRTDNSRDGFGSTGSPRGRRAISPTTCGWCGRRRPWMGCSAVRRVSDAAFSIGLVLAVDAGHAARANALERALRNRNRLLEADGRSARHAAWLDAAERELAELRRRRRRRPP